MSRRQRGQASVELIGCAVLLALAAVAVLQLLAVVRTRIAAERVADQAAVLVAEGRPLPQALRAPRSHRAARRPAGRAHAASVRAARRPRRGHRDGGDPAVSERGQISVMGCGLLVLLVLAGFLLGILGAYRPGRRTAQRAADMAALAAGHVLAADPGAGQAQLRAGGAGSRPGKRRPAGVAEAGRRARPAGRRRGDGGGDGRDGQRGDGARARAAVDLLAARLPAGGLPAGRPARRRPGVGAVIAAAAAQVGWPYVWGGESRAEGGFDCSGLVDFAFATAGALLPGRPTAAGLWQMAQPIAAEQLQPGDLVFVGAGNGAPYHVGIYVGEGIVLSAPHTGAAVGYSPLAGGGWDGYGRLLPAEPGLPQDPVEQAARRHGVPGHVLAAELELGLAGDADAAAAGLARAQKLHPGSLEQALAAQLGSASDAALVLRRGSGPALALDGTVRLRPLPPIEPSAGRRPPPVAPLLQPRGRRLPSAGGQSWLGHVSTALSIGERAALQLGERGRALPLQAVAGIQHLSRFTLTGLGALLPDPDWRDAANLAGSRLGRGRRGRRSGRRSRHRRPGAVAASGLWAARFSVIGGALSPGLFAAQAYSARRPPRPDRLRADGGRQRGNHRRPGHGRGLAAGVGRRPRRWCPPVGLTLIAVGAGLCVAGYLVRHPQWCAPG